MVVRMYRSGGILWGDSSTRGLEPRCPREDTPMLATVTIQIGDREVKFVKALSGTPSEREEGSPRPGARRRPRGL